MPYIIYRLTAIIAIAFAAVYYVHMFQLNAYHRDAHIKWFFDTLGAFAARMTFAVIALVLVLIPKDGAVYTACVMNVITLYFFLPKKAKKPLVFTKRIVRMLVTIGILYFVIFAAGTLIPVVSFIIPLSLLAVNFAVLFADILNSPLEKAIKHGFIKDAMKILAQRKNLTVIGITGSYGKTSTKYFLTKMLSEKYNVLMTPANYNTPMGVVKTVREMLKPSHEVFVCEMGAKYKGDIKELCDIVHPKIGMIASIGPQHLESFKTIENIVDTKFELADSVGSDGKVYLNFDNDYIRNRIVSVPSVSYGISFDKADCFADNITLSENGTSFELHYKGQTIPLTTRLLGMHNVQNLAGCAALSLDMGVTPDELTIAVKRLESVPHRLQMIDGGNITIIDDAYNANPAGTKASLKVLSCFDGTKIIVTPGMIELGDKQRQENMDFGRNCAKHCDYIFLVGGRIADDVYDGVCETGFDKEKLARFETVEQAVAAARAIQTDNKKFVLLENDLPDNY